MRYEKEKLKNISFPLGGIGTGCIGLRGNGELVDFEIFNRPAKNTRNGYTHFAVKATLGDKVWVKILHSDTVESLIGTPCRSNGHYGFGYGPSNNSLAGLPHFESVVFDATYPTATLTFTDKDFPGVVRLTAFNPYIPHDEYNSSLPAAFFRIEIENKSGEDINYSIVATLCNPSEKSINRLVSAGEGRGIFFGCADTDAKSVDYSDMCLLCSGDDVTVQEYWYRGTWMDGYTTYWNNLCSSERMPNRHYDECGVKDHGVVCSNLLVASGKRAERKFVIAWNVPCAYNYWTEPKNGGAVPTWRNYYATVFENSFTTATYAMEKFEELYDKTERFAEAIHSSTLPDFVTDAISANLSIIKTPTALRLEDGSFWGWEGCCETVGSCFGSCQHVWNYAYVLPYIFPRLERSMRDNTLKYALFDSGATSFRIDLPPQRKMWMRPCLDGQMGEVIKCYREWKFSGDDEWLKKNADGIFSMLEYAWSEENPDKWDNDMDGVPEGRQHHTLDMELFGASSWLQGLYLLALYCGKEMAEYLGDRDRAGLYEKLYRNGRRELNDKLFNGEYFVQRVDLCNKSITDSFGCSDIYWNDEAGEIKYQIQNGCMIDQMLADWHAALIGTESVFDDDKRLIALKSLYKYNYKDSMRSVANLWRNFSIGDEGGLIICSYPNGVKSPKIPVPYCEETMAGFEYAAAGLMIRNGLVAEGERIIRSVRDRYDGEKRNPFNEMECGSNYARSMASFALLPIYSGFSYDMCRGHIGFAPINENGKYFFSVANTYGTVRWQSGVFSLTVLGEPLDLKSISIPCKNVSRVEIDGEDVAFKIDGEKIILGGVRIDKELVIV